MEPVRYIVPQAFYDIWKKNFPNDDMKGFQVARGIPDECVIKDLFAPQTPYKTGDRIMYGENTIIISDTFDYGNVSDYEIWSGSYMASGMDFPTKPEQVGVSSGLSFRDACANFYQGNKYYDPKSNTWWAIKLYQSENEAMNDSQKNWKR